MEDDPAPEEFADTAPKPEVIERIRGCTQTRPKGQGLEGIFLIINEARNCLKAVVEDVGEITVHIDPV